MLGVSIEAQTQPLINQELSQIHFGRIRAIEGRFLVGPLKV